MDYKEIQNDNIQSILIKIQTLQKEYEVVLQQYQEAGKNYINALQNNEPNIYTALKGKTWWGNGSVAEGEVSTQEECENMCINTDNCSGATFNPVKRYCWSRKGDGGISIGVDDDYALVPQQKASLLIMKELNNRLLSSQAVHRCLT